MKAFFGIIMFAIATLSQATDLHIVSAGSKTGSLTMQASAYAKDLTGQYDVKLSIPGNFCQALSVIDNNTPTIVLWAHDYEAAARAGKCSGNQIPKTATPIRFNKDSSLVCSIKEGNNVLKGQLTIGHTVPKKMFNNVINNINQAFTTQHQGVMFNGSGQVRLALINGEVDLALLTNEHAEVVRAAGGRCDYILDNNSNIVGVTPLQKLNTSMRLLHSFDTMIYAVNFSNPQLAVLVQQLQSLHKNCNSAIGIYTKCDTLLDVTWNIDQSVLTRWEEDVRHAAD